MQDDEQFVYTLLELRVASCHRHLQYCDVNHFGFGILLERLSERVYYWNTVSSLPSLTWQHRRLNLFQVSVANCPYINIVNNWRCRNVTSVISIVRKYRCYVKRCRYLLAVRNYSWRNCVSEWERAKFCLHRRGENIWKVLHTRLCDLFCWPSFGCLKH
jgi:hypothetical protein